MSLQALQSAKIGAAQMAEHEQLNEAFRIKSNVTRWVLPKIHVPRRKEQTEERSAGDKVEATRLKHGAFTIAYQGLAGPAARDCSKTPSSTDWWGEILEQVATAPEKQLTQSRATLAL